MAPPRTGMPTTDDLKRRRCHGNVLRADAEEPAHADNERFDLPMLVEPDVAHIADLLVIGAEHVVQRNVEASQ
jgi:hypothetical protein